MLIQSLDENSANDNWAPSAILSQFCNLHLCNPFYIYFYKCMYFYLHLKKWENKIYSVDGICPVSYTEWLSHTRDSDTFLTPIPCFYLITQGTRFRHIKAIFCNYTTCSSCKALSHALCYLFLKKALDIALLFILDRKSCN